MKFAFQCRITVECAVAVNAETEQEAWARVLDDQQPLQLSEFVPVRKPIFTRMPQADDFGL